MCGDNTVPLRLPLVMACHPRSAFAAQSTADFLRASNIKNGKKRLQAMLRLCRSKSTCRGSSSAAGAGGDDDAMQVLDADGMPVSGSDPLTDGGCGALQPKFRRVGLRIELEYPEGKEEELGLADRRQILTPERAHAALRNVSDADAALMGLDPVWARPEWLVLTVLPVPPPHVRPSVDQGTGTRGEDDITHKLSEIVKSNIAVGHAKRSGHAAITVEQYEAVLQYHCATLIDNQLPGQPAATQRGGKTLKVSAHLIVAAAVSFTCVVHAVLCCVRSTL